MHTNSHIEPIKINDNSNLPDDIDHEEPQLNDVTCFPGRVPVVRICHPHHDVAVPNSVQFVRVTVETRPVELRKQVPEHVDNLLRLYLARVLSETSNIGVQECTVFALVCEGLTLLIRSEELIEDLIFSFS